MANNLTRTAEDRVGNWVTGNAGATAPVLPLMVRLMTVNGSDTVAGTELTNAGGSTYTPQSAAFAAFAGGTSSNTGLVRFSNLPTATVTGIEIWDSAGVPIRWWYGPLAGGNRSVLLGDAIEFAIGDIDLTLN